MATVLVPDVEQLLGVGGPEPLTRPCTLADVITTTPGQSSTVNPTGPRDEHHCPRVRR